MKYLKTYEDDKWYNNKIEGYVVNGFYFAAGFKEHMFIHLTDEDKEILSKIMSDISEKYKEDLFIPIVGTWQFGPFAAKYQKWIPAYMFQVPCKTEESAIKVAEELIKKFKAFDDEPVCIAISGGDIAINYEDPFMCDGSAYIKSGRYIDDPNNCRNMIKNKESIVKVL